jgi:hypothetical protein
MAAPDERRPSDRSERTERARLEQIQQQQLTESRLNEDFLHWLKNKGPNYLFVILLGLCGVMGWNWWQAKRAETRTVAWTDLTSATLPAALEEVAASYATVDAVGALALLRAADRYMASIQSGARFDRQIADPDYFVTPELREQWLAEAERLYGQVISTAQVSGARERVGFVISAHFGKAAVAESRGDLERARAELDLAAAAANEHWAPLARIARERMASLDQVASSLSFPKRADLPAPAGPAGLTPPLIDDSLIRELLTPESTGP